MKKNLIPSLLPSAKGKLTYLSRSIGTLLTVGLMAFTFTACEDPCIGPIQDICPPGHPCQNPPADTTGCNPTTAVTVEHVGCGVGVWGAYWLRTDSGDLLQPWLSNDTSSIQPGERYLISYGPAQRDNLYDSVITCMALVPMGDPIRINCMKPEVVPR